MSDYLRILKLKLKSIVVTKLNNSEGCEKWRVGGGFEKGAAYFRIDWGSHGWRFTSNFDWAKLFYTEVLEKAPLPVRKVIIDRLNFLAGNANAKRIPVTRNEAVFSEVVGLYKTMYYEGIEITQAYEKEVKK